MHNNSFLRANAVKSIETQYLPQILVKLTTSPPPHPLNVEIRAGWVEGSFQMPQVLLTYVAVKRAPACYPSNGH